MLLLLDGKRIKNENDFISLMTREPEYSIFKHKDSLLDGTFIFECIALASGNKCSIYNKRPAICRDYPDLFLMACGAELDEKCGYTLHPPCEFEEIFKKIYSDKQDKV